MSAQSDNQDPGLPPSTQNTNQNEENMKRISEPNINKIKLEDIDV
jgi:hypothetical protein